MKAGTGRTNVVNLATALHRNALAMELHRTPGWTSRLFKPIVRWPENTSLWQQWEAVYTDLAKPRYKPPPARFTSKIAGRWTRRDRALARGRRPIALMSHEGRGRADGVRAREAELADQSRLVRMAGIVFRRDGVVRPVAGEPDGAFVLRSIQARASIRAAATIRRSCCSASIGRGCCTWRPIWPAGRRPRWWQAGTEWFRTRRPDVFGVESNQFQDLLAGEFEAAFRRCGILGAARADRNSHAETGSHPTARPVSPLRRVRFKSGSPGTKLLVEQLQEFPIGDYDDGPDAMEMALRLAGEVFNGRAASDGLGSRLPVG